MDYYNSIDLYVIKILFLTAERDLSATVLTLIAWAIRRTYLSTANKLVVCLYSTHLRRTLNLQNGRNSHSYSTMSGFHENREKRNANVANFVFCLYIDSVTN